MNKKSFLVTGGAGFVGSHLVQMLLDKGFAVHVIDDLSSGKMENLQAVANRIQFFKGSILDEQTVKLAATGVDGIFHLAAVVSVPLSIEKPKFAHEVNLTGSLCLLETCRSLGCPMIFSSSAAVYGNTTQIPVSEDHFTAPISPYGVQKLAVEQYGACYQSLFGFPFLALRYFNIYGPRQDPSSPYSGVITAFASKAIGGSSLTINGDGSHSRDFIFVEDVARANLCAMESVLKSAADFQRPIAFNVGTGVQTNLSSLATAIIHACGSSSEVQFGPERAGDILHSLAATRLAKAQIGFEAKISLQEGLAKTMEFFKSA